MSPPRPRKKVLLDSIEFSSSTPCFGFAKADACQDRIIVTDFYCTQIWSERKRMFAPETKGVPRYELHKIKASVTAVSPRRLFFSLSKNYPQRAIAWIVIPFSPEKQKELSKTNILKHAAFWGFVKIRLITVRDSLFMGAAGHLALDIPNKTVVLFVIADGDSFHIVIYDRSRDGYFPRYERIVPYNLEHPEAAFEGLQYPRRILNHFKHVGIVVYEKESVMGILKDAFDGIKFHEIVANEPDNFFKSHLNIAGAVTKGRHLLEHVVGTRFYNVIETCPFNYKIVDASENVLVMLKVAYTWLPFKQSKSFTTDSQFFKIYSCEAATSDWQLLKTVVVDPDRSEIVFQIEMDLNCEHKFLVNNEEAVDYIPSIFGREGFLTPTSSKSSMTADAASSRSEKTLKSKSSRTKSTSSSKKSVKKKACKPVVLKSTYSLDVDDFIELCYAQSKFHVCICKHVCEKIVRNPIKIKNQNAIHCSITIIGGKYLFGEDSVQNVDQYESQTIHSFVEYLGRTYAEIQKSQKSLQPCLRPSKNGPEHPAQVVFQGITPAVRANIDVLLSFMITHIKEELEEELGIPVSSMAFNTGTDLTELQQSMVIKVFKDVGLIYLDGDGKPWSSE